LVEIYLKNNTIFNSANNFSNQTVDANNDSIEGLLEINLNNGTMFNLNASATTSSYFTLQTRKEDVSIEKFNSKSLFTPVTNQNHLNKPISSVLSSDSIKLSKTSNIITGFFSSQIKTLNGTSVFTNNTNEIDEGKKISDSMEEAKLNKILSSSTFKTINPITISSTIIQSKLPQDSNEIQSLKPENSAILNEILPKISTTSENSNFSESSKYTPKTKDKINNNELFFSNLLAKSLSNLTKDLDKESSTHTYATKILNRTVMNVTKKMKDLLKSPSLLNHDDTHTYESLNELDVEIIKNKSKTSLFNTLMDVNKKIKTSFNSSSLLNNNKNEDLKPLEVENEAIVELGLSVDTLKVSKASLK